MRARSNLREAARWRRFFHPRMGSAHTASASEASSPCEGEEPRDSEEPA